VVEKTSAPGDGGDAIEVQTHHHFSTLTDSSRCHRLSDTSSPVQQLHFMSFSSRRHFGTHPSLPLPQQPSHAAKQTSPALFSFANQELSPQSLADPFQYHIDMKPTSDGAEAKATNKAEAGPTLSEMLETVVSVPPLRPADCAQGNPNCAKCAIAASLKRKVMTLVFTLCLLGFLFMAPFGRTFSNVVSSARR
jgi:hypothetical protein